MGRSPPRKESEGGIPCGSDTSDCTLPGALEAYCWPPPRPPKRPPSAPPSGDDAIRLDMLSGLGTPPNGMELASSVEGAKPCEAGAKSVASISPVGALETEAGVESGMMPCDRSAVCVSGAKAGPNVPGMFGDANSGAKAYSD